MAQLQGTAPPISRRLCGALADLKPVCSGQLRQHIGHAWRGTDLARTDRPPQERDHGCLPRFCAWTGCLVGCHRHRARAKDDGRDRHPGAAGPAVDGCMLYAWSGSDANMRSMRLCSRNDAIGNSAVMAAAPGVYRTGSDRPDLAFDAVMGVAALIAGRSAFSRHAPNGDEAGAAGRTTPVPRPGTCCWLPRDCSTSTARTSRH